jgi:cytoskeletal protein CcmA (bactofilin family)
VTQAETQFDPMTTAQNLRSDRPTLYERNDSVLNEVRIDFLNFEEPSMAQCTIGPGIVVNGRVTGEITVTVSGRIEGSVALEDELVVNDGGVVVADVEAESVSVEGTLEGTVVARDTVRLMAGCAVTGDLRAPRVIIEEGARFKGEVDMDVQLPD